MSLISGFRLLVYYLLKIISEVYLVALDLKGYIYDWRRFGPYTGARWLRAPCFRSQCDERAHADKSAFKNITRLDYYYYEKPIGRSY